MSCLFVYNIMDLPPRITTPPPATPAAICVYTLLEPAWPLLAVPVDWKRWPVRTRVTRRAASLLVAFADMDAFLSDEENMVDGV